MDYASWFESRTGYAPREWQAELGALSAPASRIIRIPTGFGKTLGVLGAWCYHRVERADLRWPTRLVWALPMRVLVEQTIFEARKFVPAHVKVHALMGGVDVGEWYLDPETPAVLVGTQDMLLSRALNRGYAAPRARWPMEHGLLNHDALWVLDEVQLMDVGLATSAQLQAYRDLRSDGRPSLSWWMSATLQRPWLESVDTRELVRGLELSQIPPASRVGHLWEDVQKPVRAVAAAPDSWAELIAARVAADGAGKLTLVVVNSVDAACKLFTELETRFGSAKAAKRSKGAKKPSGSDDPAPSGPELRLVHGRFRAAERRAWREEFLRRDAPIPARGRLIVATQVVEAGVDLDASLLITELAPWPSLVQRFGRAARGGGRAPVLVLDREPKDEKAALPYAFSELDAARKALASLDDVSPAALERFEATLDADERARLYPYHVDHLLLEKEWIELFDTTPDLTGADLDISRFIRSGEERDVLVFWRSISDSARPSDDVQGGREELCPVPFLRARDWLFVKKSNAFNPGKRAWVWDWLDGEWRRCRPDDVTPGRTLLVAADCGGYDLRRGFDASSRTPVEPGVSVTPSPLEVADSAQDREELSAFPWRTIATHGRDVALEVRRIGAALGIEGPVVDLVALAGQLHDLGKAHPAFQASIRGARPAREDLAKAPSAAWTRPMYRMSDGDERRGFRHELASALALFALIARVRPDHPALLGRWQSMLTALGVTAPLSSLAPAATPIEEQVLALDADGFDLVAYLVMSHHGKVRGALHASPADQDYVARDDRGMPIRGVREGDELPSVQVDPDSGPLPRLKLTLEPALAGLSPYTGASWSERTLRLVDRIGPARLAFLEAWLRSADVRASRAVLPADALLEGVAG